MGKKKPIIGLIVGLLIGIGLYFTSFPGQQRRSSLPVIFSDDCSLLGLWCSTARIYFCTVSHIAFRIQGSTWYNNIFYLDGTNDVPDYWCISDCGSG